jgi:Tol biopolymer transport system component
MSPEQTRGQPVDRRADVWAFGCVLFEMLTGRRPFDGETVTDVLAAVTRDTPRFDALPASTPTRVRLLLARCLERDPKRRLRDMGDARLELETPDIAAAMPAPGESPAPTSRARLRRGAFLAAALMLLGVTAGLAWWTGRTQTTGPAAEAPFLRLTSDAGLTTDPALSPDGRLVVYASDRAGDDNLDLWVQQIDGGTPLRLTFDPGDEYEPSFSPDGTRIVFRSDRDGGGVYVMPALGGESRLIAKAGRQPRFSPDGRRIAYVTTVASSQGQGGITDANLFVVPSGGGAAQMLVSEKVGASSPVWSPDGAFILFAKGVNRIEDWSIVRSDRAEDAPTVLALAPLQKAGLADIAPREWVAGNRILFEAKLGDSSHIFKIGLSPPSWITKKWRLDPSPRRLTAGTEQDEQPALASLVSAPGGRRLAFASLLRKENVWSVLLDANRPRTVGKLSQLTQASGFQLFPAISMDGTKLAFISHAAYNDEVWLLDVRTGKRSLLSTAVSLKYRTHIRRDGLEVFYGDTGTTLPSSVPESDAVYTVSVSGGAPERLCEQCSAYVWDWSPDRRWLLTWSLGKSSVTAKLMDLETKKSRLLPERPGADLYDFEWSPNGRWVVFMAQAAGRTRVYVAPFDGDAGPAENTWIPITNGSTAEHHIHWSPDGGWIYAISNRDGFSCVWAYPVDPETMQPRGEPVAVFHAHGARRSLGNANLVSQSLSVARDKIVFSQGEITGNIWMTALNDRD